MEETNRNVEARVDNAMQEVLGYVPQPDDNLTLAIDSMQKLELLIALEQSLGVPFDDEALAADWWSSRAGIASYVLRALGNVGSA
jgi:acyl carrier protein